MTEEQIAVLDKQTREIEEKVMKVSFDEVGAGAGREPKATTSFLCFPSPTKVKRLPTVVLEALGSFKEENVAKQ